MNHSNCAKNNILIELCYSLINKLTSNNLLSDDEYQTILEKIEQASYESENEELYEETEDEPYEEPNEELYEEPYEEPYEESYDNPIDISNTYNTLIELFPYDIIHVILQYSADILIFKLQDYFPKLLKCVKLNGQNIKLINKNNYQYIIRLDYYSTRNLTDASIQYMVNLVELNCMMCKNITEASRACLININNPF
jgi:hypothetical protein